MVRTLPEGLVHLPPLSRDLRTLFPRGPKRPPGARTQRRFGPQDLKRALRVVTQQLLGLQDPKRPPGAGTRLGVQGSGWASGARTQLPPHPLAPLRGSGHATQNRPQEPPFGAWGCYESGRSTTSIMLTTLAVATI
jgi:hypothetical protein